MNTEEKLALSAHPGKLTLIRTGMFLKFYQQPLLSLVTALLDSAEKQTTS